MAEQGQDETPLGEFIRRQRELQDLSLRQFAQMVGISNPYLSQIERGHRDPSEKVLDAIARNLELNAEAFYEHAGRVRGEASEPSETRKAINEDRRLSAAQRRALLQVYDAFVAVGPSRRRGHSS